VQFNKRYKNDFYEKLKKPRSSRGDNLNFHYMVAVDSLSYSYIDYETSFYSEVKSYNKKVMNIHQYYDASTKKISYSIYFSFPYEFDYNNFIVDRGKENEFIQSRNNYISEKLGKSNIDKQELYNIIFNKLSYMLSDDFYEKYKIEKDVNKYNM